MERETEWGRGGVEVVGVSCALWKPCTWAEYAKYQTENSEPCLETEFFILHIVETTKMGEKEEIIAPGKGRQLLILVWDKAKQHKQQGKDGRGFLHSFIEEWDFFFSLFTHCGPLCLPPPFLVCLFLHFYHNTATREESFFANSLKFCYFSTRNTPAFPSG